MALALDTGTDRARRIEKDEDELKMEALELLAHQKAQQTNTAEGLSDNKGLESNCGEGPR